MREIGRAATFIYLLIFALLLPTLSIELRILLLCGVFWKFITIQLHLSAPPRLLLFGLGLMAILYFQFDAPYFLHHASLSSTLLIVSLLLICDRKHRRQVMMVHFSFFGLLISILLLPGAGYPAVVSFLLTVVTIASLLFHHMQHVNRLALLPLSQSMLKTAIPATMVLLPIYFFTPELKPPHRETPISGLSLLLEPGRFASLALSDRIAFRSLFADASVTRDTFKFYWRLGVLEDSFGMTWRSSREEKSQPWSDFRPFEGIHYRILLDDGLGKYLPTLEHTRSLNPNSIHSQFLWVPEKRVFRGSEPLVELISGLESSFPADDPGVPDDSKIYTSPRVRALVDSLRPMTASERIAYLLHIFEDFRYTLEPGLLDSDDPLDQFLFVKRRGFCEHFAAAFATLLRMAGTPARIVTGFHGGERLGNTGFVIVRESDAHAWTEVWMEGRWQRVDPTSVVPGALPRVSDDWQVLAYFSTYFTFAIRLVTEHLQDLWPDSELLSLLLILGTGSLLLALVLRMLRSQSRLQPWERDLHLLLATTQSKGFRRELSEPLSAYLSRIANDVRGLAPDIQALIPLLNRTVYGASIDSGEIKILRRNLQKLRRAFQRRKWQR